MTGPVEVSNTKAIPEQAADDIGIPARVLFDSSSSGLVLVDPNGTIIRANPSLEKMFGYPQSELPGQKIEVLLPHRHRDGHVGLRNSYVKAPENRPMGAELELTGRRRDGLEFPVVVGLNSVQSGDKQLVCASVNDDTERRRAERELRESNTQLEEFTYLASHDLRSPIRGIANLLTFIIEDFEGPIPEHIQKHLDRAIERTGRMEKLIDDLLIYARSGRQDGQSETFGIRALVDDAIEMAIADQDFKVQTSIVDENITAVRTPLLTVLRNLVSNAYKHHDLPDKQIEVKAGVDGNYCRFDIIDDGPGISNAFQERMFRLFQTSSASRRDGAGLGLAVVKRLIDAHGARIAVVSGNERRGSLFRVWWPRFRRTDIHG